MCLMIENFFQLYIDHNYRGCESIYFLAINGRPRRKLSHRCCYKFQLFFSIMGMFSLELTGAARGHSASRHPLLHAWGWRRSGDKAGKSESLG